MPTRLLASSTILCSVAAPTVGQVPDSARLQHTLDSLHAEGLLIGVSRGSRSIATPRWRGRALSSSSRNASR